MYKITSLFHSKLMARCFNIFIILVMILSSFASLGVQNASAATDPAAEDELVKTLVTAPQKLPDEQLFALPELSQTSQLDVPLASVTNTTSSRPNAIPVNSWRLPVGLPGDTVNDIATDEAGNVYATGNSNFGGGNTAFVIMLDRIGTPQWSILFPVTTWAWDICVDNDGVVYVAGTINEPGTYDTDIFLAGVNIDGTALWEKTFGDPDLNESAYQITADPFGNVYVAGKDNHIAPDGNSIITDAFVSMVNPDLGELEWTTLIDVGGDYSAWVNGISTDPNGGIYTAGTVIYGEQSPYNYNAFAAYLDPTGAQLWYTPIGEISDYEDGYGIAANALGESFIVGIDQHLINGYYTESQEGYIAKLNPSGVVQWNIPFGTPDSGAYTIALAGSDIYVSGASGEIWGNPVNSTGQSFLAKFDQNGVLEWNTFLENVDPICCHATTVVTNSSGDIYVSTNMGQGTNSRAYVTSINDIKVPLIFIHGVTGSQLHNESGEVWPNLIQLRFSKTDDFLRVLRLAEDGIHPYEPGSEYQIEVGDILRTGVYGPTITALRVDGDYQEGVNLFVFAYDWRLNIETLADRFLAKIDEVRTQTGSSRVDILAHSMGGMITRTVLSRPESVGKVRRVVTLGTPVLGATKLLGTLEYQTPCFLMIGKTCWTNAATTQEIITNFPAAYQVLPGPAFDLFEGPPLVIDRDTNGDGQKEGPQPYAKWSAIVSSHRNAELMPLNLTYHGTYDDLTLEDPQVEFYRVVGDLIATPDQIREYNHCFVFSDGYVTCRPEYEVVQAGGDGTVPVHSADLYNRGKNIDYRNGIPNYYAHKVNHLGLAQNSEVLDFVISFFEHGFSASSASNSTLAVHSENRRDGQSDLAMTSIAQIDALSATPESLSGIELETLGQLDAYVEDSAGNVLGKPYEQPDAVIEESIPAGSYYAIGNTQTLFLSDAGAYTAHLKIINPNGLRLRVRTYSNDEIDGQAVFNIDVPAGAELQLAFTSSQVLADLRLQIDSDADGVIDQEVGPDSTVTGSGATDQEPPITTLSVSSIANGQCQVTLTAEDEVGGSGLATTYYLVDGLSTETEVYTSPFSVTCGALVKYMSVDRAGNTEFIKETQTTTEPRVDAGDNQTIDLVNSVTISATYSDPDDPEGHTATIDWGDGIVENVSVTTMGEVPGEHIYATGGDYTVEVCVTDSHGGVGCDAINVKVIPSPNMVTVATGGYHTCALSTTGGMYCWGNNSSGQLGGSSLSGPIPVSGLGSGVIAMAVGDDHSCALTSTGGVKCWGKNYNGQLGDGTTTNRSVPVNVNGLTSGVIAITAGGSHTCALTASGGVKCWGYNSNGQLGNGSTTQRTTPVNVSGLTSGVAMISAGGSHTCAVTTSGGAKCWGYNSNGQLGDGTETQRTRPVNVSGLTSGVSKISAGGASGGSHTCALTTGGGVKCWGDNSAGKLGDGTSTSRTTPVNVVGLTSGVTAVEAGSDHTCALTTSGAIKCWGRNWYGEIGDGTYKSRNTPADVIGLSSGVQAIATGSGSFPHTCAVTTSGYVKCWGHNSMRQIGIGETDSYAVPVNTSGLHKAAVAVETGSNHTCALTASGGVKCWGDNVTGQLGDGTTTQRLTPVDVSGLTNGVVAVSAGGSPGPAHTCALTTGGGVKCWGGGWSGQLGDGTTTNTRTTPVDVSGLASGVAAITTGTYHTCALTANGGVKCWGKNSNGQLGDGTTTQRTTPVDVSGLTSGVVAISAGEDHTCALMASGGVKCWGVNGSGRLGDGTTTQRLTPVDVSGLTSGVVAISAGSTHTCALTATGGMKCWGHNMMGEVGDGTNTYRLAPVDVIGLTSGVTAISAGGSAWAHTCAMLDTGDVLCWGFNHSGQVGNGLASSIPAPMSTIFNP